jgi:tripartite-type tricarboxylate transporter receptor subunit TctC
VHRAGGAGGFADGVARLIGQRLSERLGQPVVTDNRGGAGGNIGSRIAAAAPADGYTLLVNTAAISINVSLHKNPGYDIFRDFVPVAITGSTPGLFAVHASNPAGTLQDLIRTAKAKHVSYATAGVGSSSHLAADYLFRSLAGLSVTHVPFQGGGPATAAAIANQIEVLSLSMPPVVPHVKAGRLKGLAVSSLSRVDALPQVPTVAESGVPGYSAIGWYGMYFPAGTSPDIVRRLYAESTKGLGAPDVKERLAKAGNEYVMSTPEEFVVFVRAEIAKWTKVVKDANIKIE